MKARAHGAVPLLGGAILLAALALGGCGLGGDDYSDASLREVIAGTIPNNLDRYRVPAPRIAAARRNTGIVREGSLFLVIVGPDLRAHVERWGRDGVEYGIRLKREPRTHLVLERIWADGVEHDLFEDGETLRAEFPQFVGSSDVPYARYRRDVDLAALGARDAALAGLEAERIAATLGGVETRELPTGLAAAVTLVDPRVRTDRPLFVLTSDGLDWVVVRADLTTKLMLDFLITEKKPFRGGIVVRSLFDERTRETTGLAGTARIRWIELGGALFFQAP